MRIFTFNSEQILPAPPAEVFPFFSSPQNLQIITPPWLSFEVLTPKNLQMHMGMLIDYSLRIHGIPLRWQSEITAWEPPRRFVDEQRRGPYRMWRHEHRFVEQDGNTLVIDQVEYAVPGGRIINSLVVAPDVARIFAYRSRRLKALFPSQGKDR